MSSGAESARLVVSIEGLSPGDLPAPDFSATPQVTIEGWQSARDATGNVMAWACIRGDTSAWSDDATEVAESKLIELASGTAARLRGSPAPMHVVASVGRGRTLQVDDGTFGRARTFVAFSRDPDRVYGCFVTCIAPSCDAAQNAAIIEGASVEPPPPGVVLRSLGFVVHHPHAALAMLAATLIALAMLAILTRKNAFPRKS